jgi:hypothetical protein
MTADFTLYRDGRTILIRPENATARKHLEDNVAEYARWLVRFYRPSDSSELLGPGNGALFVKPGCFFVALADTLVKRGFTVVRDDTIKTAEPPANADFLVYYEGPNVLVRPQNLAARNCLETTLAGEAGRWVSGALVAKDTSVIPLIHTLIAAGFKVVGERALVQTAPRIYVNKAKWWLYTGGRSVPPKLVSQILKGAGAPN